MAEGVSIKNFETLVYERVNTHMMIIFNNCLFLYTELLVSFYKVH